MFSGSIVALVTPFTRDGDVDYASLKRLVEHHIQAGTDAIVSVGTTGESATLTVQEHISVVAKTVEFAAGRIPVIAGTGSNATHEAVQFCHHLNETGISGYLSVTPYYNKPTQEGLFLHYQSIAQETDIPIILYNVPGRTAVDLRPETVARLAELKTIVGLKDATGDLARVAIHRQLCPADFKLLSGDDATGLEFLQLGGDGVISVTNNIAAADMANMVHLALAGKTQEARAINYRLLSLHKQLFIESSPIPVKWAVHQLGLIDELHLRLPLTPLTEPSQTILLASMKSAGLL